MPQAKHAYTTPKLPIELPRETRRLVRSAIEQHMAATEALIAFLDDADGDTEDRYDIQDEPHDADAPDVAWNETHGRGGDIGRGDSDDAEPSLSLTNDIDQARALKNAKGFAVMAGGDSCLSRDLDLEAEHDGREPDEDLEPGADLEP